MRDTAHPWRQLDKGFSLFELLAVIAIIAILTAVIVPNITSSLADSRVRAEARSLDSLFQKARMMAALKQRPVRVVLNCARKAADACVASLQTAVYAGINVVSWAPQADLRRQCHERVMVSNLGGSGHDGDASFNGIYWAIFMPDNRVYSDPRPFDLYLHDRYKTGPDATGWRVTLSNDSGRMTAKRHEGPA